MLGRGPGAVRLGPSGAGEPADDEAVGERMRGTIGALGILEREIAELRARLELVEELGDRLEGRILDLRSIERRLAASVHGVRLVLAPGEEAGSFVRWVEQRGRGKRSNLVLAAAPIQLGAVLRESLFTKVEAAVLTSATLTTNGRFDFLRGRLGLSPDGLAEADAEVTVEECTVPSPFDFASQALIAVPTDLPTLEGGAVGFQEATAAVVSDLAEITDGGVFVLFTAHTALRRVAQTLREQGSEGRWPLFVQGEDDRHRLLARFVESGRGVLLGTTSFWEGVDVPGDPLRGLVIQKLPFRVPTEPITAARMEALEREGQDPFSAFMLPHAALRLKQGFGRLVRSRTDRGAVLILDDRIVTKRYGRYLRGSPARDTVHQGRVVRPAPAGRGLLPPGLRWPARGGSHPGGGWGGSRDRQLGKSCAIVPPPTSTPNHPNVSQSVPTVKNALPSAVQLSRTSTLNPPGLRASSV